MGNRIIKETIRTSKTINALPDFLFRVWVYLITYVDDYGRGSADAQLLKGFVFPRNKGITERQIQDAIQDLASRGMIQLYEHEGEPYFYFPNWAEHQRIRQKVSKYPEPPQVAASGGNMRRPAASGGESRPESNPIQSNTNTNPESESRTHAHAHEDTPLGRVMTYDLDKINPTPSPAAVADIQAYVNNLDADVIIHAMGIAVDERKTAWSYINGILRRYAKDGLTTMNAVLEAEQKFRQGKEAKTDAGKSGKPNGDPRATQSKWNLRSPLDELANE